MGGALTGMFMTVLIIIVSLLVMVLLAFFYAKMGRKDAMQEINDALRKKQPVSKVFNLGKYVSGLHHVEELERMESLNTLCAVTADSYIFLGLPSDCWQEIAEIRRDSINSIYVENKSYQPLGCPSAVMMPGGVLSPDKRREKGYERLHLLIDWNDKSGIRRRIVFEFSGPRASEAAYCALNELQRYARPNMYGEKRFGW